MREKKEGVKRPYDKPSLRIIELAAEEIMGGACKMGASKPGSDSLCQACSNVFGS